MLLYISSPPYSDHYSCIVTMKVIFGVITFAAAAMVVGSAPALSMGQVPGIVVEPRLPDYYRDVRSQYPQYVSPCAAAAAASGSIPGISPAAAYQVNISPYHGYPQVSQQYGYGVPHYRSGEMMESDQEMMGYSDMDRMMSEQVPMARYAYAAPAASHAAYAPVVSPATSGPVFGVFPNANTGGCNVPLLFSCTPSVVPGHVVPSQTHYNAAADSYRGVEPLAHHNSHESPEPTVHENLSPAHESIHPKVNQ